MKTQVATYKRNYFSEIVNPVNVFTCQDLNLLLIYQFYYLNISPQYFTREIYLYSNITGELKNYLPNQEYPVNDVLFIDDKTILLACGEYDGGMNYNGQLIVWDIKNNERKILLKGRHFEKCYFNEQKKIEILVFPEEDECFSPPEKHIDSTYILKNISEKFELDELELVKTKPHEIEFIPLDRRLDKSINLINAQLEGNLGYEKFGMIRNVVSCGNNSTFASIDNFGGLLLINNKKIDIRIELKFGMFRQIEKVDEFIYLQHSNNETFSDGHSLLFRIDLLTKNVIKLFEGEFDSFSVNKYNEIILLSSRYKPNRKVDYYYFSNNHKIKTYSFEKDSRYRGVSTINSDKLYFIEENNDPKDYKILLHLFSSKDDSEIVFKLNKFIGAYNSNSYILIDDKTLILQGRLTNTESEENKLYGVAAYNIYTEKELLMFKTKDPFYEIKINQEDYSEICCLTKDGIIEIYSTESNSLVSLIDSNLFTSEKALSIEVEKNELTIGTTLGTIFKVKNYER